MTAVKELKGSVAQMDERWCIHKHESLKTPQKKGPIEFPQRYVEDSKVDWKHSTIVIGHCRPAET